MPKLIHCIYASAATRTFDTPQLADLLQKARECNHKLGLTGMLLHTEGSFFQVLEGDPEVVDSLYMRIERDERHQQVTKILHEAIPMRSFAEWTMGFAKVSRKELAGIAGVNDFFGTSRCLIDLDLGRAKKLLTAFREGRWRKSLSDASSAAA
jgi:hypothetical protein